jgi:hypothetical protein
MPDVRDPVSLRAQIASKVDDAIRFMNNCEWNDCSSEDMAMDAIQGLRDVLALLDAEPEQPKTSPPDTTGPPWWCETCESWRHSMPCGRDECPKPADAEPEQGWQEAECRHTFVRDVVDGHLGCDRCGITLTEYQAAYQAPRPSSPEEKHVHSYGWHTGLCRCGAQSSRATPERHDKEQ